MKLVRWLLSNIILIVIVLVLSYMYVYWDNLTDEDTPAGPAIAWLSGEFEFVSDLVARLENSGGKADRVVTDGNKAAVEVHVEKPASAPASAPDSAPASAPVAVAAPVPVFEQKATEDKFVTPEIVRSLTRLTGDIEISEPEPAESQPARAEATDTAEFGSTRELWIAARRSFHRRDYENSIKSYEQLIAATQDNYDAHGELGNVYFNQGRIKEAAASYYDAAAVLVRLGQVERAASLIHLLGRMDTEKARELQELIASARS